ncbi:hypothetical protein THAOC_08142, partial [Thalassiosira oceanica]
MPRRVFVDGRATGKWETERVSGGDGREVAKAGRHCCTAIARAQVAVLKERGTNTLWGVLSRWQAAGGSGEDRSWRRWTEAISAASAWASGPIRLSSRAGIPSARAASATMKLKKLVMEDKSDPLCETCSREVKQFEEEYGDDWEGNVIEYDNGFVNLPEYVIQAVFSGDFRTVLHWLGKGNVKERANAKYKEGGNFGLLYFAAVNRHYDLMSYLLLNGAAANMLNSTGTSMLAVACLGNEKMEAVPLLLSWGAEIFDEGKQITSQEKKLEWLVVNSDGRNAPIINPVSSELGGR